MHFQERQQGLGEKRRLLYILQMGRVGDHRQATGGDALVDEAGVGHGVPWSCSPTTISVGVVMARIVSRKSRSRMAAQQPRKPAAGVFR